MHLNLNYFNGHFKILDQLPTTLEVVKIIYVNIIFDGTLLVSETLLLHLGLFSNIFIILLML